MSNIYTEDCIDSNEVALVATSLKHLVQQLNADRIDTENNYLVLEEDLTPMQRSNAHLEPI